jgi:hypothetical protein
MLQRNYLLQLFHFGANKISNSTDKAEPMKAFKSLWNKIESQLSKNEIQKALPFIALAFTGLVMLWPCLRPASSFAFHFDNEYMVAPIFSHASELIRNGHLPLWMNTPVGGIPLYNSPQFCLWYPLFFIFLPIYKSSIAAIYSIHFLVLLHILILEFNTYFFLRTIKLSRFSSVLGAVLFAFSANTLTYCQWGHVMPSYSWMLLYLGALVLIFQKPSIRAILLAVFSMTMLVLAMPAQPLILAIFVTLFFVVYQFVIHRRNIRFIMRPLGGLIIVAVISALLTAPVLGPVFLEYKQMIRYVTQGPPVVGFQDISFNSFLVDQMSIRDFAGIVFPLQKKKEVGSQLLGPFILTLAFFGIFSGRRENHIFFFTFLAAYSLLSAAGANLGLAYLNYHLPFIKMIREPSKFLFFFVLAACVLAAIGFDHLRSQASIKGAVYFTRRELLAMSAVLIVWASSYCFGYEQFASQRNILIISLIWGALLLFLWAAARAGNNLRCLSILLFGIAAIFMNVQLVRWKAPSLTISYYLGDASLRLHSVFRRLAVLDPSHDYRVLIDGNLHKQQAAMIASFYGVRTFNIYGNPLPLMNMQEIYYHQPRPDKYYQAMGAKYLICDDCTSEATKGYTFKEELAGIKIFATNDVAPYYYLKSRLDAEYADLGDYASKTNAFPLDSGILMAEIQNASSLGLVEPPVQAAPSCALLEEERSPNRLAFALNCKIPHILVLNELYTEQWQARWNGQAAQVFKINGNQIGLHVPAGASHYEIKYSPKNLRLAMYPFFTGLFAFFGLVVYSIKKCNS